MADDVKSCAPIPCPSFEDETLEVIATSALDQLAARAYQAHSQMFDGTLFLGQTVHMLPYEKIAETGKVAWRAVVQQLIDDLGVDRERIGIYP